MKFGKKEIWFNPSYLFPDADYTGKCVCLDRIIVFDNVKGEIVTQHHSSWFGSNNDGKMMEVEGKCVMKRKIDLTCKTAFVVKSDNCSYESRYDLYLPSAWLDLTKPTHKKSANNLYIETTYKSRKYPYMVFVSSQSIQNNLVAYSDRIDELAEKMRYARFDNDLTNLENLSKELVEAVNAFVAEKKRVTAMSVEECMN